MSKSHAVPPAKPRRLQSAHNHPLQRLDRLESEPGLRADGTMKRDSLAFLATMVIDLYLIDHMPGCIG
jgi:hypothetical protein